LQKASNPPFRRATAKDIRHSYPAALGAYQMCSRCRVRPAMPGPALAMIVRMAGYAFDEV
jgi:hypothetical protein